MTPPYPTPPPPRVSTACYFVVDIRTKPPTPVDVKMHRSQARDFITWSPDAEFLRVRRARATLYAK